MRTGQDIQKTQGVLAMLAFIIVVAVITLAGVFVSLGWTADSRQLDRRWYPASRDPKP